MPALSRTVFVLGAMAGAALMAAVIFRRITR